MGFLKFLTGFDWLSPTVDVISGDKPIFVQDGLEQDATQVIGHEPSHFDSATNCWVFMVPKNDFEKVANSLKKRGFR